MRRGVPHRLVQQRQTFLLPALTTLGAHPEPGLRIVFRNHQRGHLVDKAVHAGLTLARRRLQLFVLVVRQTDRQSSQCSVSAFRTR